ncbi:MAG: RNA 2',3'-cyclic phosphodiesterase [bacterium]|nr:RNA 2',3'-cyclic phosphodiesterase [bacterium]
MIRTFISISIPDDIRERIAEFQLSMSDRITGIKWVKPENIHITLKFIGERKEELVYRIIEDVINRPAAIAKFDMDLSGTGVFPNIKRPRIYWIGINKGKTELSGLAEDIENLLEPLGIEKEKRPFKPHITIGRFRRDSVVSGLKEFTGSEVFDRCCFHVDRIHLMKSILKPSGAEYSSLAYQSFQ